LDVKKKGRDVIRVAMLVKVYDEKEGGRERMRCGEAKVESSGGGGSGRKERKE